MQMHTTALRQEVEAEAVFDTHPEVSLDFQYVQAALKKGYTVSHSCWSTAISSATKHAVSKLPCHVCSHTMPSRPTRIHACLRTMIEEGVGF